MKRILLSLLTILMLQPIAAMDHPEKKHKTDATSEPDQEQQETLERVLEYAARIEPSSCPPEMPLPSELRCPPAMPLAPELIQYRQTLLNSRLRSAAADGDCKQIEQLLKQGADLHEKNNFTTDRGSVYLDVNAFDLAVKFNREPACKLLISKGAQPTQYHLFDAARWGDAPICKLLITSGINVNAQTEDGGSTLLIVAALNTCYGPLKMLLDHGADINAQSHAGQTALMLAAAQFYMNREKYLILIDRGANIHLQDEDGDSALDYAARAGNAAICELLLMHGAKLNNERKDSAPILIHCLRNGIGNHEIYACAKVLLKYGAHPNILSTGKAIDYSVDAQNHGTTALMKAASHCNLPLCELLVQYGADCKFQNSNGKTAETKARKNSVYRDDFEDSDENEEFLSPYIALLNDPATTQAVIMREDNPQLQRTFGKYSNICHALQKRELGAK